MYCGNVIRVLTFSQRNPSFIQSRGKHFVDTGPVQSKHPNRLIEIFSLFIRNITPAIKYNGLSRGLKPAFDENTVIQYFKCEFLRIPLCLKKHSVHIVRTCTQQCECVVAHRIRRGQQIFSLYTRLWDEVALRELVYRMKQLLTRRCKLMLWGAVGVSVSHGDKITEEEIRSSYMEELEFVHYLRDHTVMCSECHQRLVVDMEVPNIVYCQCAQSKCASGINSDDNEWAPFIEREDLIVWRKVEENQGLYAYKVYGRYDDVTAEDFFQVQIDTEYRKEWDTTAVELEVLESDPQSNSDVIYWEMQWPRMFSNRDYVFNRRYMIDTERKLIVLVSRGGEHPKRPERKGNFRVTDYYSYMVIRPLHKFTEPGIEFSLTYFENPGVSIPSTIQSWVAKSGMPDFLGSVRVAARDLAVRRFKKESLAPLSSLLMDGSSEPEMNASREEFTADVSEETEESKTFPESSEESESITSANEDDAAELVGSVVSGGGSPEQDNHDSEGESKPKEEHPKTPLYFHSFPYQDPPDISYLQFHSANLFT